MSPLMRNALLDEDSEEGREVFCTGCNCWTELTYTDVGIGPYEFWGMPGNDTQIVLVTKCCEGDAYRDSPLCSLCEDADVDEPGQICQPCREEGL